MKSIRPACLIVAVAFYAALMICGPSLHESAALGDHHHNHGATGDCSVCQYFAQGQIAAETVDAIASQRFEAPRFSVFRTLWLCERLRLFRLRAPPASVAIVRDSNEDDDLTA